MPPDHVEDSRPVAEATRPGSAFEVLCVFLRLGLTSFGGPVAHLGYFRAEFVERRQWLDERSFSDLVALCQFLPGPSSSQVGIAIGLARARWLGALAAWIGFTLPSTLLLIAFAYGVVAWPDLAASGAVHGLKLAAVAVLAQAVWGMGKSLCPDRSRAGLAIVAALLAQGLPGAVGQMASLALGGLVGYGLLSTESLPPALHRDDPMGQRRGGLLLLIYFGLLLALPALALASGSTLLSAIWVFYKAGALVLGGGHVVLPLLQAGVVPAGWISNSSFLAGYGAAQAVPGPLFAFAAYLGTAMGGWPEGLLMLAAIFLPGFLLVLGALPFWELLRRQADIQRAMAGVNAAVVGVLLAALYDPVWISSIYSRADFCLALGAFGLLVYGRQSALRVVLLAALGGWLLTV